VLPFWQHILRDCDADDSYVVAIRNPRSIAASLFARQGMAPEEAYRLWLVHMVPFLRSIARKKFIVVDYDLLMRDPHAQLERIRRGLEIEETPDSAFAAEFLKPSLRHTSFTLAELEDDTPAASVTKEAYSLLFALAQDRLNVDSEFWPAWQEIESEVVALIPVAETPRDAGFSFKRLFWRA
jgi:hypothetical protein